MSEADVIEMEELHYLVRRSRLMRKRNRRLLVTKLGRKALASPATLIDALAPVLLPPEGLHREVAELASALLLSEGETTRTDLEESIYAAVKGRWQDGYGVPISEMGVIGALSPILWRLNGVGALDTYGRLPTRMDDSGFSLNPQGAKLAAAALRDAAAHG